MEVKSTRPNLLTLFLPLFAASTHLLPALLQTQTRQQPRGQQIGPVTYLEEGFGVALVASFAPQLFICPTHADGALDG